MTISENLIKNSQSRLPADINNLIAKAKENPSILTNPTENLQKRAVLLTEAMVPANIVHERILGGNDYQDMNFFQRGLETGAAICRLVVKLPNGISYGTGFLICDSLIMTNNHVLKDASIAAGAVAEFDYELDSDNNYKNVTRIAIDPAAFFYTNPELDYTIVALQTPLASRKKIRLIQATGKAVYNESLSIIQHPDGREKKIAVRNNIYIKSTDTTIWYTTDTSPGSSGSPVFNDDWQLVALHHSGVPEQTTTGKFLLVDGTEVDSLANIQESKIKWKANEGIRISAIVADLGLQISNGSLLHFAKIDEIISISDHTSLENAADVAEVNILPTKSDTAQVLQTKTVADNPYTGSAAFSAGNVQVIININGDALKSGAYVLPSTLIQEKETKPKIKIVIDPNYNNREGYKSGFLNLALPLSDVVKDVKEKKGISLFELKYHHFSTYQADNVWNMPYITAVNIDGALFQDYNRPADAWYLDPRLKNNPDFGQMGEDIYKANNLDRGHMVRREDPSWGTPQEALLATFDTYHFTNATPQHSKLNQGKMEWQGLENYILDMAVAKKLRVTVFTGPVLIDDPNEYELYRDIRVPMQFYKVVVVNKSTSVYAAGYVLSQYKYRGDLEAAYDPTVDQKPISEIIKITDLDFSPLLAVDTFGHVVNENRFKTQEAFFESKSAKKETQSFRLQTLSDIAVSLKDR